MHRRVATNDFLLKNEAKRKQTPVLFGLVPHLRIFFGIVDQLRLFGIMFRSGPPKISI